MSTGSRVKTVTKMSKRGAPDETRDTNETKDEAESRATSRKSSRDIREKEGDEREWQSISRQILEVQELTRETDGEGKTEKAALREVKKTFEEEKGREESRGDEWELLSTMRRK